MVEIKKECDFYELRQEVWCGAVDTLKTVIENKKTNELMYLLEDLFYTATDITEINDFLWFDRDYIYEELEIQEED